MTDSPLHHVRRRAATYLLVLGSALLITVIGLSALTLQRIELRMLGEDRYRTEARLHAQSAIELGMHFLNSDPDWRVNRGGGAWLTGFAVGDGRINLEAFDPVDGDVTDADADPVVLRAAGTRGPARHLLEVTATPMFEPYEFLNTCIHAGGNLSVKPGRRLTVTGGPVSSNQFIINQGAIVGDAEANVIINIGTITGTRTGSAPAKTMPSAGVFARYVAKATQIISWQDFDKDVLGPGINPWGAVNPDGVYYINTGGRDLHIKDSRFQGTLVVECSGKTVIVEDYIFMHPHRPDYPVLIVKGDVTIKHRTASRDLIESDRNANYNPPGAPYEGQSDSDQNDTYPNEIRGLVHVIGNLKLEQTARIRGTIVCEGSVTADDDTAIIHDPALAASPPEGYRTASMVISPGSWKRVVD